MRPEDGRTGEAATRTHRGQGIDAAWEERPGVPREAPPRPAEGAHWRAPDQQILGRGALDRTGIDVPTPVFGTGEPPRLASGLLRRLAYRLPDHRASRWLLLLAADRVDVVEHRLGSLVVWLPALAAAAVGYLAMRAALRSRA